MTTPAIERLIEAVKYFVSSDQNQIKPTSKPVSLKEAKAGLLELANQPSPGNFLMPRTHTTGRVVAPLRPQIENVRPTVSQY